MLPEHPVYSYFIRNHKTGEENYICPNRFSVLRSPQRKLTPIIDQEPITRLFWLHLDAPENMQDKLDQGKSRHVLIDRDVIDIFEESLENNDLLRARSIAIGAYQNARHQLQIGVPSFFHQD